MYPVKSCGGAALTAACISKNGVLFDREWRVIFGDANDTLTQRECSRMARVRVAFQQNRLVLSFDGDSESVSVPLICDDRRLRVQLSETTDGEDEGDEVAKWLSERLGVTVRLLRVIPVRHFNEIDEDKKRDERLFIGQPILLTTTASLEDLNSRLADGVRMNRFRPNIVVTGAEAYQENDWTHIRIGDIDFMAVEPCGRCALILVDQETGQRSGKEPLRELATYRRIGKEVVFGQYFMPLRDGLLKLDAPVEVLN